METTYTKRIISEKGNPDKDGLYDTDKGKVFFSVETQKFHDLGEQIFHPTYFYEPTTLSEPSGKTVKECLDEVAKKELLNNFDIVLRQLVGRHIFRDDVIEIINQAMQLYADSKATPPVTSEVTENSIAYLKKRIADYNSDGDWTDVPLEAVASWMEEYAFINNKK